MDADDDPSACAMCGEVIENTTPSRFYDAAKFCDIECAQAFENGYETLDDAAKARHRWL